MSHFLDPSIRRPGTCKPADRVAAFLISPPAPARSGGRGAAAPARRLQTELHAQLYREVEIVRCCFALSWVPDFAIPWLAMSWETAWLPKPATAGDCSEGLMIDMAALGHALHAAIRPAALLPVEAAAQDPFAVALRRIEFESSRLMQAQIMFLKDPGLLPVRSDVNAAVERRHAQVRELWSALLEGIGVR
jgi:hypothetical protein